MNVSKMDIPLTYRGLIFKKDNALLLLKGLCLLSKI